MAKWINFDTTVKATGSITIVDQGGNTTDINQLHGTNGFTLTDAESNAYEYIFDKNNALGVTGTTNTEGIVIQVYGFSAASDVAGEVIQAIQAGHGGTILCSLSSNVVTLTQNTVDDGNVTIAVGSTPTPSYISYTGFSGGVITKYSYPIDNLSAIHVTSATQIKCYLRNPNQPNESVSDDIVTITCVDNTSLTVYERIIKQLSGGVTSNCNITSHESGNITSVSYTAGS